MVIYCSHVSKDLLTKKPEIEIMTYFKNVKDLNDLKQQYKTHHPDLGGDLAEMQAVNSEYDYILETGSFNFEDSKTSFSVEKELREVIERLVVIQGISIELCGTWVWITGDTRPVKDALKSIGCFWARKKAAWYWRSKENRNTGKGKSLSMDKIRARHGSKVFASKQGFSLS